MLGAKIQFNPERLVKSVISHFFIACLVVGRLIKYTGYGNAAGLLAHRGLMMGHPPDHVSAYSSDSENSETEEYKQVENRLDGCSYLVYTT